MTDEFDESIAFPPAFWKALTKDETDRLFRTGHLDAVMCAKLSLMIGKQVKPPLAVYVTRESLDRLCATRWRST
jgi:hypothetical protein